MPNRKGIGGHHSASAQSVVWLTPKWILDALGSFDLDPCAAPEPRPWATAAVHYAEAEHDGLNMPWVGPAGEKLRCWVNPPYGNALGAWLGRLAEHGCGTALIFARTETDAFFRTVWDRASAILFMRGRVTFCRPDGTPAGANGGAPSVLIAYGEGDAEILHDSGIEGKFIPLSVSGMLFVAYGAASKMDPSGITWRSLLTEILNREGRALRLAEIYAVLSRHPKAKANPNWRPKVRQVLNRGGFDRVGAGQYKLDI